MRRVTLAGSMLALVGLSLVMALTAAGRQAVLSAEAPAAAPAETKEQRDARMKWWREARFGMFIHWGIYSVPAGTYNGKQIAGIGEWIMNRGKIPVAEYAKYAGQFNPVKFNADEWVRLARDAGMRYLVITSKHHDGFAMFASKASPYNIVDATPFKRDPLKELAEACRRHGIRLGFYYSQAQDWHHPGGAASGGHWDKAQDGDMDEYVKKIAVPQVREILSNYGPISVLWWDTPTSMNKERADWLRPLLALQPGIITNDRLGGGYSGDLSTPEQRIPATGMPGRNWETCMTMNGTWGFKSYDDNWKPTQTLIRNLCDIASKGGNYLLNVGPTAEGEIPAPSVERLREVGRWMRDNGEAIYATTASPFKRLPFNGRCTQGNGRLYLHVFDWPADRRLLVPVENQVSVAYLLTRQAEELKVETTPAGKVVLLPDIKPDSNATVVVVKIEGEAKPLATVNAVPQGADGTLRLGPADAEVVGGTAKVEERGGQPNIGYWTDAKDQVRWQAVVTQPGTFEVEITFACQRGAEGSTYTVSAAGQQVSGTVAATGSWETYKTVKLGQVKIEKAGACEVLVKPTKKPGLAVMNLRSVVLKPAK